MHQMIIGKYQYATVPAAFYDNIPNCVIWARDDQVTLAY